MFDFATREMRLLPWTRFRLINDFRCSLILEMASGVKIFVQQNGKTLGPYSEAEVVDLYDQGLVKDLDLAMVDGVTGWHPLESYL